MKNILLLFGGQSSEHEISCISGANVADLIDKTKYNLILVGITKNGKWLKVESPEEVKNNTWYESKTKAMLSPDEQEKSVFFFNCEGNDNATSFIGKERVDVIFPVLHGLYGEDGTVQGLCELTKIPYVGCNVVSSAVSMDKFFTKVIVNALGIRQAKFVPVYRSSLENMDKPVSEVESTLSYPVFVKPSNSGSSRGISKAHNREELIAALNLASKHDRKILVEEAIVGREIECAVFSDGTPIAAGVGEILPATEFYDFDAKYNDANSETVVSPVLPDGKAEEIKNNAVRIFQAVGGFGLARVDFFLETETNEVVFNEINTLPGFTSISMYSVLCKEAGINNQELIEKLINSAFMREVTYTE